MKDKFQMSSMRELTFFLEKPLLKDSDGEDFDVHTYRNMVMEIVVLNILSDALPITTNGVNTPRSDKDSLKLMELMVFLLQKGCIKQFWNTVSVKRSDDVTRLQVLVDRKKIMISEDVIREILQLDDVEGVENVAEDVANDTIPSPPSHNIPSSSQEQSSPPQQPQSSPQAQPQGVKSPTHFQ
nr:hypothetical protein [Tanacetum cinerariifolium]